MNFINIFSRGRKNTFLSLVAPSLLADKVSSLYSAQFLWPLEWKEDCMAC